MYFDVHKANRCKNLYFLCEFVFLFNGLNAKTPYETEQAHWPYTYISIGLLPLEVQSGITKQDRPGLAG